MPENNQHDVYSDARREAKLTPNVPRLFLLTVHSHNTKAAPDPLGTGAGDKNMVAGFQHAATGRAKGLIEWLDVLAVEISPGVHPVKMDKPTKKLDFSREFAPPNELGTIKFSIISMEELVCPPT